MFTGIIQSIGHIHEYDARGADARMVIAGGGLDFSDVALGDSIAVNGVCLTVVVLTADSFTVDVSAETLHCTAGFLPGAEVNLEKALRLADRLGGHLVSGHVDGVGTVHRFVPAGESHLLEIDAPTDLARYIIRKGSITVNGVSLTVNKVDGARFALNLIPHTLQMTTLKHLKTGSQVNLEVDMIARYVERLSLFTQTTDKD
ncbi:MAG: riboflavin synthase [Thiobacillus sp.]|nr:riboflavin synthase [Gammaproteobacteria bacterium]MDO9007348.1 riboflavin synthase [Thiobacillus sp.]MDP3126689.1 riboflavin synthase [Thiobacillus sp.]